MKVWNYGTRELVVTLSGHRGAVTALAFGGGGGGAALLLASGARDTDVVVWDVASQCGLFRRARARARARPRPV